MQYGTKNINQLTNREIYDLLKDIIKDCVDYAGDSYEDFARPVIKLLVKNNLVDYGSK